MPEVLILNTDDCCYGVLRDARARQHAAAGASTTWAVIAAGIHLFPFRTEKLSPPAPMVLGAQAPGRVGRRPPHWRQETSIPPPAAFRSAATDRPRSGSRRAEPGSAREAVALPSIESACTLVRVELRDGDLVLREWTEDDVPAIVAGCNDPEIAHWIPLIPHPYTEADALAFLSGDVLSGQTQARCRSRRCRGRGYRDGSEFAGLQGTIGYWVAAAARGRGICTRAVRLRRASRPRRSRAAAASTSITDPENLASQRVAEKVGFRREGVLRAHLRHPDGRIRDSVMFSLLPGELRE